MAMVFKCREENRRYQQCLNRWYNDEPFVNECKEIYLQQRAEFRLTGIKKRNKKNDDKNSNDNVDGTKTNTA